MKKITGVMMSTWIVEVTMPPTIGAAIGFMMSEPTPVLQRIGNRPAIHADRHQLWPKPEHRASDRRLQNVFIRHLAATREPPVEGFVQIQHHHDACLHGHAVKRD